MKKGKVVHRIPKDHYLVSNRNRVFTDKKLEASVNACRGKMIFDDEDITMKKAYGCKIFDVYEEMIPHQKTGESIKQIWIDHKPTVSVVAITNSNKILFVQQYRNAVKENLLELPAGSIDDGENPLEAAQRELAEETGWKAKSLILLYTGFFIPGYGNERMYFYLAKDLFYDPLPPDAHEDIIVTEIEFKVIKEYLNHGTIRDIKTVLGLKLAEKYFID
jgi:ADP-ribose pyrophosphatase